MKKKVSQLKARPRPKPKASAGPKFKVKPLTRADIISKPKPKQTPVQRAVKKVKEVSRSIADALVPPPPESSDD